MKEEEVVITAAPCQFSINSFLGFGIDGLSWDGRHFSLIEIVNADCTNV